MKQRLLVYNMHESPKSPNEVSGWLVFKILQSTEYGLFGLQDTISKCWDIGMCPSGVCVHKVEW